MTILSPGKQIFTYIGTSTYKYVKTIKKYEPLEVLCLFHLMTILIGITNQEEKLLFIYSLGSRYRTAELFPEPNPKLQYIAVLL